MCHLIDHSFESHDAYLFSTVYLSGGLVHLFEELLGLLQYLAEDAVVLVVLRRVLQQILQIGNTKNINSYCLFVCLS